MAYLMTVSVRLATYRQIIGEHNNWELREEKWSWPNIWNCLDICMEEWGKTTKNLHQGSRKPDPNKNQTPPEYKSKNYPFN